MLGSLHRGAAERGAKLPLCHHEQLPREGACALRRHHVAGCERRLSQLLRELDVIRAYLLADITTVNHLPDLLAKLGRYRATKLDCEIRDAAGCIEDPRGGKGISGAGVEAARTLPATVRLKRRIRMKVVREKEHPEKEERSARRVHQVRVLSEPSEPSSTSEIAFENRSRIDVGFADNRISELARAPLVQLLELVLDDAVIIVAPRVPRHGPGRSATPVVEPNNDCAQGSLDDAAAVAPFVGSSREITHLARVAGIKPRVEEGSRLDFAEICDSDEVEPQPVRLRFKARGEKDAGCGCQGCRASAYPISRHQSRTAQRA
ncbi:MAG: hypothetical protein NVS4B3_08190 [Gemmatimonadaceae bacterium]